MEHSPLKIPFCGVLTVVYETQKHFFFLTLPIICYAIKSLRFENSLCFLPQMQTDMVNPVDRAGPLTEVAPSNGSTIYVCI